MGQLIFAVPLMSELDSITPVAVPLMSELDSITPVAVPLVVEVCGGGF
jgi:hypothetical protein